MSHKEPQQIRLCQPSDGRVLGASDLSSHSPVLLSVHVHRCRRITSSIIIRIPVDVSSLVESFSHWASMPDSTRSETV
jgi:hypothetical protein